MSYVDWVVVAANSSPYQTVRTQQGIAVNGSSGPVTVLFFNPQPGDVIVVRDYKALSASGSAITLSVGSSGGQLENPQTPGTYGATGSIQSLTGASARYKYSSTLNLWIMW